MAYHTILSVCYPTYAIDIAITQVCYHTVLNGLRERHVHMPSHKSGLRLARAGMCAVIAGMAMVASSDTNSCCIMRYCYVYYYHHRRHHYHYHHGYHDHHYLLIMTMIK